MPFAFVGECTQQSFSPRNSSHVCYIVRFAVLHSEVNSLISPMSKDAWLISLFIYPFSNNILVVQGSNLLSWFNFNVYLVRYGCNQNHDMNWNTHHRCYFIVLQTEQIIGSRVLQLLHPHHLFSVAGIHREFPATDNIWRMISVTVAY